MYQLLLVDDEPVIRMTFRNLLPWDDTPWHIAGMVSSGEEALAFVEQHQSFHKLLIHTVPLN